MKLYEIHLQNGITFMVKGLDLIVDTNGQTLIYHSLPYCFKNVKCIIPNTACVVFMAEIEELKKSEVTK